MNDSPGSVCPAPRIRRACVPCRAKKARCLPRSHVTNVCQRCHAKALSCVFPAFQESRTARISAHASASSTVIEEESISLAELGFPLSNPVQDADAQRPFREATGIANDHRSQLSRLFPPGNGALPLDGPNTEQSQRARRSSLSDGDIQGLPAMRLYDSEIELYLSRYDALQVSQCFPFLPLPPGWSLQYMREERPLFLLGVLSAMTQHQMALNTQLHSHFLRTFSERAIVKGEKSLDILQGALAQFAWYPMHLSPQSRRTFQVLQICISIVQDLGFDQLRQAEWSDERYDVCEAYRYLSSLFATAFQRRNVLGWDRLERTAGSVVVAAPSISIASVHTSLQELTEIADETCRGRRKDWTLERLSNQLEAILATISNTENYRSVFVKLAIHHAQSQVYACVYSKQTRDSVPNRALQQDRTLDALRRCLDATRCFFETLLTLLIDEYRDLSFMQWAQLVQVLKVVPKICFEDPSVPQWDVEQAKTELRFGLILESLCYRMHELTSVGQLDRGQDGRRQPGQQPAHDVLHADHFLMFKSVLQILKEEYDERCQAVELGMWKDRSGSRCPVVNGSLKDSEFWNVFEGGYSSLPGGDDDIVDFGGATYDWQWMDVGVFPSESNGLDSF